ncbi:MAG TPA: hypothetical protein VLG49_02320, partial [Rhabdochlamydiaceae bacterium]|nr:hypothetical protein [Rhabdochlamydiaceae bacterium]
MANYGVSATAPRPFSLRPIQVEENKSKDVCEKAKKTNVLMKIVNTVLPKNPVHKHREFRLVPLPIEIAFGKHLYRSMVNSHGGHYNKRNYEGLMKVAGAKLSKVSDRPDLPWQFSVIDSNTINAWCLPGG